MNPNDSNADIERKLDASIKEVESLLAAPGQREAGKKLDTSRINKVASDLQAQSRDFKNRVEEAKRELDAARERHENSRNTKVGHRMGLYLVMLAVMLIASWLVRR